MMTPRMQQLSEEICRYARDTGQMPTLAEMGRRMGLSRMRTAQIWAKIERWEQKHHLTDEVHVKRAQAGYLLAVLNDIEKAAKIAGRVYPWKRRWQGPRQQPEPPKPNKPRPWWVPPWSEDPPDPPGPPRWEYRPRWVSATGTVNFINCPDCSGTGVVDGEWCAACGGEATIEKKAG